MSTIMIIIESTNQRIYEFTNLPDISALTCIKKGWNNDWD